MYTPYETRLIAHYLSNALNAWEKAPELIKSIAVETERKSDYFEIQYAYPTTRSTIKETTDKTGAKTTTVSKRKLSKTDITKLGTYFDRVKKKWANKEPDEAFDVLIQFANKLGFDPIEQDILKLVTLSYRTSPLSSLYFELSEKSGKQSRKAIDNIASFLGYDDHEIRARLTPESPLLKSGLLYFDLYDADGEKIQYDLPFHLNTRLGEAIFESGSDLQTLHNKLVGMPCSTKLTLDSFDHIKQDAAFCANLLQAAIAKNEKGINILIYGEPGAGKTEFCKALAQHIGLSLYAVGENDEEASSLNAADPTQTKEHSALARLADMRLVQNIVVGQDIKSLLLFDEAEDLLGGENSSTKKAQFIASKRLINRLLETNVLPVLYTTNNVHRFDPAFLRRFTHSIELNAPPASVRARIMQESCDQYAQGLTKHEVTQIANAYNLPPAAFTTAARAADLTQTGKDGLLLSLKRTSSLLFGKGAQKIHLVPANYDLNLLNADQDLVDLCEKISASGRLDFSMCLNGVSGAGKTEYAHYLAQKLGMEVMAVRCSDILGKYVGETEENIANTFKQALQDNRFLVIDEADSLLRSREKAEKGWEITQVNEMLSQMEEHPLPFVCSTNLMKDIDDAALRRFVFKVKFDAMKPEQTTRAFETFFDRPLPADKGLPANLTPGDFANVKKQATYMGYLDKDDEIVSALLREARAKKKDNDKVIQGFAPRVK